MPFFPQSALDFHYVTYPAGPTATGVTVTTGGSAHTKGANAELAAATAFACTMVRLFVQFTTNTAGRVYLIDIATGAAGAEVVVAANILLDGGGGSAVGGGGCIDLPLAIPAGERIAVSAQSGATSVTLVAAITLKRVGTTPGITSFTTYGANTGASRGTAIDPGASANTKGLWTELTASSASTIQALLLSVGFGGNGAPSTARWYVDLGIGASGSETVIVPDVQIEAFESNNTYGWAFRSYLMFPYIPSGTRVAARASCSINNATDRLFDLALLGAPAPSEAGGVSGIAAVELVGGGLTQ